VYRNCKLPKPIKHKQHRNQRGATLVEYAFILILFLTILFGISSFGHALYVYHALNHAAKEGTRWASVNGHLCGDDSSCNGTNGMNSGEASLTQIQDHTLATLAPSIDQSQATVTATFTHPAGSPDVCASQVKAVDGTLYGPFANYPGCTVTVQVQYPYNVIFPLLNIGPINMSSTSEMVIVH
jgi:Flp pilus assembly protein TadG